MVSKLLFNKNAMREIYHPATAEHHTWGEMAEYYRELIGLKYKWVSKEEYLRVITLGKMGNGARWQLEYDRLFHRVMDNSKILGITGLCQSDLTPVYDALKGELDDLPDDAFSDITPVLENMQKYSLDNTNYGETL